MSNVVRCGASEDGAGRPDTSNAFADAADPRLRGSDKADHAEQLADYGADLGGPILKDKLWFWGSYGKQDLRIQRLNQTRDKTLLKDYSAKLKDIGIKAGQTPTAGQLQQLQTALASANANQAELTAASKHIQTWAKANCTG